MVRVDPFQFFGKALRPGPGFSQIRLVQLKPLEELGAKLPSVVNPLMNLQVWRFILPVSGDSVFLFKYWVYNITGNLQPATLRDLPKSLAEPN